MTPDDPVAEDARSQRQRMEAGDLYLSNDAELQAMQARAARLMQAYNNCPADDGAGLRRILTELIGDLGPEVAIRPPFHCDYGRYISIGRGSFANYGLIALDVARITIGEDVQIGPNVQLLTPTHPIDPADRRSQWEAAEPITIGDNVWLGGGALVLAGVTVGEDSIIGAGAVVTKDVPAGVVAVGNSARVVRQLT